MLPITNRRGIHIPHSLATAAAIIALLTALSWDASERIGAETQPTAGSVDLVAPVSRQDSDAQGESAEAARSGAKNGETGVLSGLLPLVLPNVSRL
ncbi:MAG: hypothetical protein WD397_00185 [Wenzhouxiangellaceae bacterium]